MLVLHYRQSLRDRTLAYHYPWMESPEPMVYRRNRPSAAIPQQ
jgi:hypothetical protein